MKQVQFVVEAKKYFEVDAERFERVQEGDLVIVTLDFEGEKQSIFGLEQGKILRTFQRKRTILKQSLSYGRNWDAIRKNSKRTVKAF